VATTTVASVVTPQQETEHSPALPVVSLALRLLIPTFLVFWAVLGPVAANPDNPSDRRALLGVAELAMDSGFNGLAIETGVTFVAFALALLALAWVNWIACDIIIACHRARGLRAQSLPFGLVRRMLVFIQLLAGVGAVAAAISYIDIVHQDSIEPVWTSLLLIVGGGYLIWTCGEGKRTLV
jgi:Na+/proline symporter